MKRTKKSPPKGKRCDASIGVNYGGASPTLTMCAELATVELVEEPFAEVWVCEKHARMLIQSVADTKGNA